MLADAIIIYYCMLILHSSIFHLVVAILATCIRELVVLCFMDAVILDYEYFYLLDDIIMFGRVMLSQIMHLYFLMLHIFAVDGFSHYPFFFFFA